LEHEIDRRSRGDEPEGRRDMGEDAGLRRQIEPLAEIVDELQQ
jgi:hypothetical protein